MIKTSVFTHGQGWGSEKVQPQSVESVRVNFGGYSVYVSQDFTDGVIRVNLRGDGTNNVLRSITFPDVEEPNV